MEIVPVDDAGVVEEEVDPATGLFEGSEAGANGVLVLDSQSHDLEVVGVLPAGEKGVGVLGVAAARDDLVALGHKLLGELEADSATGPRDEDRFHACD